MITEIITGEKIQQMCDLYIGKRNDFQCNPIIAHQPSKHLHIDSINQDFDNPYYLFCYSHLVNELSTKLHHFKQKFILITHNSDQNIENTHAIHSILDCHTLVKWYAQNITFQHEKLHLLPIGLANSMWPHGNVQPFHDINTLHLPNKTKSIYFNFNIKTNIAKRQPCYNALKDKLEWLPTIPPVQNIYRLKEYQFCICPEGNGVDTHRLWECFYLKVVPIVIQSPFSAILQQYNAPIIVVDKWEDSLTQELHYDQYDFNNETFLSLLHYTKLMAQIKG